MCEKRILKRIFGPMREEVTEDGENCITRSFIHCTLHKIVE